MPPKVGKSKQPDSVGTSVIDKKDYSPTDLKVEKDKNNHSASVTIKDKAKNNNSKDKKTCDELDNENEPKEDPLNLGELEPDKVHSITDSKSKQGQRKEEDSQPDKGGSSDGSESKVDHLEKPKSLSENSDSVIEETTEDLHSSADNKDEQSVNGGSEKQNSLHQDIDNSKDFVDRETVRKIVKEELRRHKRSFTKMQTGFISFTAFLLGGGMMSYWWKPHYTNMTNTTYVLSDNITHSSIVMEDVTQKLEQCQANLTQIKDDFKNVQDNFVYLKNEVTEVNYGITGTIEGVKGELKEDFLLLKRDINILTGTQQIHGNKYITYSETIFFLIAGLILEPLLIFLLYKYLPWRSSASNHDSDAHVHDGQSAQAQVHIEQHIRVKNRRNTPRRTNILDKICSGNLEESICILSFYEETQDMHRSMLTSALQQKDFPMKPFLLQLADPDALSIPRCRFVFVFVDFNERNVILETPGQDLGEKKVVTVKACQKMGADVFVIYTRDRDSSHLGDGKLYNKDLSAFTKHYLLKELTAKNRGLSVNDKFSSYQKSHIRRIVLKK
ncbi:uncharacterized protein LOC134722342 [Mytilus trossulus]|uniref:uncharacterized protein LOC134722342 n=1 Tax=Mytilus trossulus TaxID=6551 RepID=UPI003004DCC8